MTEVDFQRLSKSICIFARTEDTTRSVFLGLYVDEINIVAPDPTRDTLMKKALHQDFHIIGHLKVILGWEIERNPAMGSIIIHQQQYVVVKIFFGIASHSYGAACEALQESIIQ
jgi:hypothetical protein